ncbi:MAG: hypothetical protein CVU88_03845 [Firmicutes bacterium HGW-Firmicutes-13]|nr:MAG: hypothetical protein CVU88_03845 [Firmicutes bacterium HGW-Firmicutes-13]
MIIGPEPITNTLFKPSFLGILLPLLKLIFNRFVNSYHILCLLIILIKQINYNYGDIIILVIMVVIMELWCNYGDTLFNYYAFTFSILEIRIIFIRLMVPLCCI